MTYNFEACPISSSFYSYFGQFISITFASIGAAFGTAKAGTGMASAALTNEAILTKLTLPVIMAGVLSIYGLITSLTIGAKITARMPLFVSYAHFAAGISTGVAALSAGLAIGICGQKATECVAREPSLFVCMIICMIFGEALALYGVIVSLVLVSKNVGAQVCGTM